MRPRTAAQIRKALKDQTGLVEPFRLLGMWEQIGVQMGSIDVRHHQVGEFGASVSEFDTGHLAAVEGDPADVGAEPYRDTDPGGDPSRAFAQTAEPTHHVPAAERPLDVGEPRQGGGRLERRRTRVRGISADQLLQAWVVEVGRGRLGERSVAVDPPEIERR